MVSSTTLSLVTVTRGQYCYPEPQYLSLEASINTLSYSNCHNMPVLIQWVVVSDSRPLSWVSVLVTRDQYTTLSPSTCHWRSVICYESQYLLLKVSSTILSPSTCHLRSVLQLRVPVIVTYIRTIAHSPKPQSQEVGFTAVSLRMLFPLACMLSFHKVLKKEQSYFFDIRLSHLNVHYH